MITFKWAGQHDPEANQALGDWCTARIALPRPLDSPYVTMGVFNDAELIAVIVYNNYHPETGVIEFHGASTSPRWLARHVLREMFAAPFERWGVQLLVTRNSDRNKRLHRMLASYGMKPVHIPRLRGRDEGEMIWTLSDDDWRGNGFD